MKKSRKKPLPSISESQTIENETPKNKRFWNNRSGGERLAAVAVCFIVVLGTLGAGLKYIEESAQKQAAQGNSKSTAAPQQKSWLASMNPFTPAVLPSPTPTLSKEYIYAGSRLLAVEDANANAAPPTDLAVFRESNGYWYVMGPGGTMQASQQFGAQDDKASPGDYDGDGKTDFCVFRPSNGTWYVMPSSGGGSYYSVQFGQTGDIPVPADYTGDGKTDLAFFRANNWYILRSEGTGYYTVGYGVTADDKMAPADYDGDGRADIGVWRKTTQTFYTRNSSNGNDITMQVGTDPNDVPVSADYDGDGKADYAVKSGGNWIIRKSLTATTTTTQFGNGTDKPVHNDYDADGKVDLAVWRDMGTNNTAQWYIMQTTTNTMRTEGWGTTGDTPVPVFYRR